jgi:SAM-dependent methyltransferase
MKSLYDFPAVFEVVMARPPGVIATEVQTIQTLLTANGIYTGRILELACGACAHGIPLAQRGFTVTGLDRAPAMLATAKIQAIAHGVTLEVIEGDVVNFAPPTAPYDAAIFTFETFPLITDAKALRSHFAAVRRSLRPGGIYLIDVDRCYGIRRETGEWGRRTLPLTEGDLSTGSVEVWHEERPGDWVAGINYLSLHCRIHQHGVITATRDDWAIRCYRPWDLALLVQTLDGWELDGFYSWQTATQDIAVGDHYFTVIVAR